jgi:hypothetical protein
MLCVMKSGDISCISFLFSGSAPAENAETLIFQNTYRTLTRPQYTSPPGSTNEHDRETNGKKAFQEYICPNADFSQSAGEVPENMKLAGRCPSEDTSIRYQGA